MGVCVEDAGGFLGVVVLLADEPISPWRAASIRAGNLRMHNEQVALARRTRHETIPMRSLPADHVLALAHDLFQANTPATCSATVP